MAASLKPTIKAVKLFHQGNLALAEIEENGIRINTDYLAKAMVETDAKIKNLQEEMRKDQVWSLWRKEHGQKANMGSREQLAYVLFDKMGLKNQGYTEGSKNSKKKRYKCDESVLATLDVPFVKNLLHVEKLKKLKATYLEGIQEETVDGYIHCFQNLNRVKTFRSSSDSPNLHNQPIRDQEQGEVIRKAFIPRPGRRLVENDFSSHEFKIAASCWEDPAMIEYASDETKDVHRDQAADIFMCGAKQITKAMRTVVKAKFVFATLYGSWWMQCASNMWGDLVGLKMADGTPLLDHLQKHGIKERGACNQKERPKPGTFELHMKGVEERFLQRFPVFARKKEERYREYLKNGLMSMPTGFVEHGLYSRNDVMNHWIQGGAFHCLLWVLISLRKELKNRKMLALIVGQIHDCILGDVPDEEIQDYLNLVQKIVEHDLPREWSWLKAPLVIEAECTETVELGGNWWGKETWVKRDGIWGPKARKVA